MVERQLPKLHTRVRFPSPAPLSLRQGVAQIWVRKNRRFHSAIRLDPRARVAGQGAQNQFEWSCLRQSCCGSSLKRARKVRQTPYGAPESRCPNRISPCGLVSQARQAASVLSVAVGSARFAPSNPRGWPVYRGLIAFNLLNAINNFKNDRFQPAGLILSG
jgi:hypothetical protein